MDATEGTICEQRTRSHTRERLNVASEVQVAETTETVEEQLAALEQAVTDLGRQVAGVIDETITPAELSVLPGLKVLRPIPIVIEESADDVIARWIEPGLTGVAARARQSTAWRRSSSMSGRIYALRPCVWPETPGGCWQ